LASLRLCLQTLGREDLASRQREQLREMMLDDIERLSAFIDDILEANRIEHGSQNRARGHVSLAPLAERCASIVRKRHKIPDDGISLDIDPALALETDVTALEAILKNLLDNAVKYSDPPIAVRLQARQDSSGVTIIDVIDSGVGIPAQDLKRVFDRFYRVDNEAIRSRRGTGLGLFVVRALVRSLRGRLRAHSDGLGRGTRMSIELPHSAPPPSNGDQPFSASAPNT
jgi:signal transduction histidine kinase